MSTSPFKSILAAAVTEEEETSSRQTRKASDAASGAKIHGGSETKKGARAKASPKAKASRTKRVTQSPRPQMVESPQAIGPEPSSPKKEKPVGRKRDPHYAQLTTYIPGEQRRSLRARAIEQDLQVTEVIEGLVAGWLKGDFVL